MAYMLSSRGELKFQVGVRALSLSSGNKWRTLVLMQLNLRHSSSRLVVVQLKVHYSSSNNMVVVVQVNGRHNSSNKVEEVEVGLLNNKLVGTKAVEGMVVDVEYFPRTALITSHFLDNGQKVIF